MERCGSLALAFLVSACARDEAPATRAFELQDVVGPAVAALEAEVGPLPAPDAPGEDVRELAQASVSILASSSSDFRDAARDDLCAAGEAAVPVLREILLDGERSAEERAAAAEGLGAIGGAHAAEVLVETLETHPESWVRAQAAWRLADAGQDQVLPRLILRLKYEKDSDTVIWLASTLARFGNYSGVEGLVVLRDAAESPELRASADQRLLELAERAGVAGLEALVLEWQSGELETRLAPDEPSPRLQLEIWRRVAGLALWNLRDVDENRFVLARLNAWVVGPLGAALHDANVYTRVHAAQCLERMGKRASAAGPELVRALAEPRTAPAAATALGAIAHAPAVPALEAALQSSTDIELRVAAARALGMLGADSSLDILEGVFRAGGQPDLRQAVAETLAGSPRGALAVPFLAECLTSPLADAGGAEAALERWLAIEDDEELRARWRELAPPQGRIETAEEAAQRRAARAALLATR